VAKRGFGVARRGWQSASRQVEARRGRAGPVWARPARLGSAALVVARRGLDGTAMQGRPGAARHCSAGPCEAWRGAARRGGLGLSLAWRGPARFGRSRRGRAGNARRVEAGRFPASPGMARLGRLGLAGLGASWLGQARPVQAVKALRVLARHGQSHGQSRRVVATPARRVRASRSRVASCPGRRGGEAGPQGPASSVCATDIFRQIPLIRPAAAGHAFSGEGR